MTGYNGKGTSPYEPDIDAPWNAHTIDLRNDARCETCAYWFGVCGLDTRYVKRAEDRCPSWNERRSRRARVAGALEFHAARSAKANSL